jgi:hypothetical protein
MMLGSEWQFTELVPEWRQAILMEPVTFEDITRRIVEQADIRRSTEKGREDPTIRRALFILELRSAPDLVDLFHNGIDGYRARYLRGPDIGDAANNHFIEQIRPRLENAGKGRSRLALDSSALQLSLDADAKVWMHQGLWSRNWKRKRIQIELHVPSWLKHQHDANCSVRKKVKLGALCRRESSIDVKGGFLDRQGRPVKLKHERALQIHRYGFT